MYDVCLATYFLYEIDTRKEKQVFTQVPLGVLSLAASVREKGISVFIADLNKLEFINSSLVNESNFSTAIAERLASVKTKIFGFSTICASFPMTLQCANELKKLRPESTIVLGGPQASSVGAEVLRQYPSVDYVLRGEADLTFPLLIKTLLTKDLKQLPLIPGLVYRSPAQDVLSPIPPKPVLDLDHLPIPAYDLWEFEENLMLAIEVGRGCPFNCTFCSTSGFFSRKSRKKSVDRILNEIEFLTEKYKTKSLAFVINEIVSDREWIMALCETLQNSKQGPFEWGCALRADFADEEILTKMKTAGCMGMFFGIEGGSEYLQKATRKNIKIEKIVPVAEICHNLGIRAAFSFITGFPEEKREDIRATTKLMLDLYRFPSTKLRLALLSPLSGSSIQKEFKDSLIFDYIPSSFLSPGLALDQQTLSIIQSSPQLFPDYFGIPTKNIDRAEAYELQCFCSFLLPYFRWPFIALHQLGLLLYDVFSEWLEFRSIDISRINQLSGQYRTFEIRCRLRDLILDITKRQFPDVIDIIRTLLTSRIYDEYQIRQIISKRPESSFRISRMDEIPCLAPNFLLQDNLWDYRSIIKSLQSARGIDTAIERPTAFLFSYKTTGTKHTTQKLISGEIIRELLSPLKRSLILECNGENTVDDITDRLAGRFSSIPEPKHVVFALNRLANEGVLILKQREISHLKKPRIRIANL